MRNELYPSDDRALEKKWYVIYLSPRSEKIAFKYLERHGYEVFLPLIRETRVWRNRQTRELELPLFPNYLFIRCFEHELYAVKGFPRVVGAVIHDRQPASLSLREVESIRRMLQYGRKLEVAPCFYQGQQVRICSGPLTGYEGVLVRQRGKTRFGLRLKAINYTVLIDSGTSELERL